MGCEGSLADRRNLIMATVHAQSEAQNSSLPGLPVNDSVVARRPSPCENIVSSGVANRRLHKLACAVYSLTPVSLGGNEVTDERDDQRSMLRRVQDRDPRRRSSPSIEIERHLRG